MKRVLLLSLLCLAGCEKPAENGWQGYVEGEFVLLASPYAGQLQKLHVRRGDLVEAGKPVFALERENESAARAEANERLRAAQARLENLQGARRAPELEVARAEIAQARAALDLSPSKLAQEERLFKTGFSSKARFDEARSGHDQAGARVREAEAQLRNLQLPLGRDAERRAAQGEVAAAQAALKQADWKVEQKSVGAPVSGMVQDTFFVEGEWVPAGRPVASILPPGNIKVRFYVPEPLLQSVSLGRTIEISCDGCPTPVAGKVSFVSPQAEYTPPVLYSKESRTKLVFLIEARLEGASLRPGQPVGVRLK